MPRGRAGLLLVPPEKVLAVLRKHSSSAGYMPHSIDPAKFAPRFLVSVRTVRRWVTTGLPLHYGETNVTCEQWERFVATGDPGRREPVPAPGARTGVDRQVSRFSRSRADRSGSKPVRASRSGQVSAKPGRRRHL